VKGIEQCVWVLGREQCEQRATFTIAGEGAFGRFDPYGAPLGRASHCYEHACLASFRMNERDGLGTYRAVQMEPIEEGAR
jgi:hypothetical protein